MKVKLNTHKNKNITPRDETGMFSHPGPTLSMYYDYTWYNVAYKLLS